MLIIGAGGHAKELLHVLILNGDAGKLYFFDNISQEKYFCEKYRIIKYFEEAAALFRNEDEDFVLGLGNPSSRSQLYTKFEELGGHATSVISSTATIGDYDVDLGPGLNIMHNVFISNSVKIGKGSMLNYGCSVHHDAVVGEFCELSPRCQLLGKTQLGNQCSVGAGAIILPGIKLGNNVVVGAGAVVTKHVPDNSIVSGVPARKTKTIHQP